MTAWFIVGFIIQCLIGTALANKAGDMYLRRAKNCSYLVGMVITAGTFTAAILLYIVICWEFMQ